MLVSSLSYTVSYLPYVFGESVDPDQTSKNVVSNQGLHCLTLIQQYYIHMNRYYGLVQILATYVKESGKEIRCLNSKAK